MARYRILMEQTVVRHMVKVIEAFNEEVALRHAAANMMTAVHNGTSLESLGYEQWSKEGEGHETIDCDLGGVSELTDVTIVEGVIIDV